MITKAKGTKKNRKYGRNTRAVDSVTSLMVRNKISVQTYLDLKGLHSHIQYYNWAYNL